MFGCYIDFNASNIVFLSFINNLMNPISLATLERTMSFIIESHSILNQTAEDASVTYIKKGDRTLLIISGRPFF